MFPSISASSLLILACTCAGLVSAAPAPAPPAGLEARFVAVGKCFKLTIGASNKYLQVAGGKVTVVDKSTSATIWKILATGSEPRGPLSSYPYDSTSTVRYQGSNGDFSLLVGSSGLQLTSSWLSGSDSLALYGGAGDTSNLKLSLCGGVPSVWEKGGACPALGSAGIDNVLKLSGAPVPCQTK